MNFYLKNNSDLKLKDYYIDDGYTGTDFNRPDFQRLLTDMKNEKINTIIVKDLSRLGRNYIEVGNYLEQIFPLYNIRFIAINDNIDNYKDPESVNSVIVPFKNLMNDEYARDISNKVRSVLNTKKINGEFTGISAPYGYLKDPKDKHKFIVDKKTYKVVIKIFKMILDGKSRREVADELNKCGVQPPAVYKMNESIANSKKTDTMGIWKNKMIDRILQNRAYTGDLIQGKRTRISHKIHKLTFVNHDNWIIVPNHHQALVSEEEFNQVQNIIYSRDSRIDKSGKLQTFSGHLKCNECGNSLILKKAKNHEYYYCSSYVKEKKCSKHTIAKNKLEQDVLKILNNQINLLIEIDKQIEEITGDAIVNYDIEILNGRIKEIECNIDKYKLLKRSVREDFENQFIDEEDYNEYQKEYELKLKNLQNEKNKTEDHLKEIGFKTENSKDWIKDFIKNKHLETLNKKIVDELIENIYVSENKNIKIVFKYQDEYFEAIDFIKQHNHDIMHQEVIAI